MWADVKVRRNLNHRKAGMELWRHHPSESGTASQRRASPRLERTLVYLINAADHILFSSEGVIYYSCLKIISRKFVLEIWFVNIGCEKKTNQFPVGAFGEPFFFLAMLKKWENRIRLNRVFELEFGFAFLSWIFFWENVQNTWKKNRFSSAPKKKIPSAPKKKKKSLKGKNPQNTYFLFF